MESGISAVTAVGRNDYDIIGRLRLDSDTAGHQSRPESEIVAFCVRFVCCELIQDLWFK